MDFSKQINLIKELVNFNKISEQFLDLVTEGGAILRVEGEELALDAVLILVTEEGEQPATEGEYILDNGTKLNVGPEGKIIEIIEAEAEVEEPAAEEEMSDETTEVADETTESTEKATAESTEEEVTDTDMDSRITAIEELIKELIAKEATTSELMSKQKEALIQTVELVEKIAEEPAAKSIDLEEKFSTVENTKNDSPIHSIIKSLKN